MDTEPKKKSGNRFVGTAVFVFIALLIVFAVVQGALQDAGILPTSVPQPTNTPIVLPLYQTITAEPPKATYTPEPTRAPEENAWYACVLFIERELKLSTFDAQKYNPAGVIKAGDDFLVDVYYATNDVTYSCYMTQEENSDFRLMELSKKE